MNFNEYPVESLMFITNRPEIVFTHGKGSWLYDNTGKRYLDFIQGWAVNSLGHCNAVMIEAIDKQARTLINPSPAFYNAPMAQLAGLLTQPAVFDKVFFANSGAEANEGAIKLSRKWGKQFKGGAYEIITFDHSFHGRTLATMSASGKPGWDTMFAPQVPGFPKAESERHRVGRAADHRKHRRRHARADPGRRRRDSRDARIHAATARADEKARPALDRR